MRRVGFFEAKQELLELVKKAARGLARPSAVPPFTKEVQGKQGKPFGNASG